MRRRIFRLGVGAQHVERDVRDEMEFHLELRTQRLIAAGHDPASARAEALRQFGDVSEVQAECLIIDQERDRAMTRANRMQDLQQDVGFALRSLRRNKGFAAILLCILALGIGANTAMFTLVDALVLRSLDVKDADRLITIGNPARTNSLSDGGPRADIASYPMYVDLRDGAHTLSGLYATGRMGRLDVLVDRALGAARVSGSGPEHPRGRLVTGNFFSMLGTRPALGRLFTANEDQVPGRDPVVVLSYDYFQKRFAEDPSIIGRTLTVNGAPLTIIGVAARNFAGDMVGQPMEVWIPMMMQPTVLAHREWLNDRNINWLNMMGRLAPGATIEQARSEITTLLKRTMLAHVAADKVASIENELKRIPVRVESGAQGFSAVRARYARALYTLMAAVGLVLLVVCANVANLMLARAASRGREMSIRMALGARRVRLVQQLLTESLLIAFGGGALGLFVAYWGTQTLLRLAGGGRTAIPLNAQLNGRILAFTLTVSVLTALLFGLVPALRATRVQLATALRAQGRGVTGAARTAGRMAAGKVLVVAQVALSLLLLVGTGMLVRSTQRLEHADVGLEREKLVIASVDAQRSGYSGARLAALVRDLQTRAAQTPGVAAASFSENGIFSGTESGTSIQVEGFTAHADADTNVAYNDVGSSYFRAIGAHLLLGRDFEERDNETGAKVVVINQSFARFFFPKGDALGHHVTNEGSAWEIVGMIADVRQSGLREPLEPRVYFPMVQMKEIPGTFKMEIRTTGDPTRMLTPIRRALLGADASLVVLSVNPLNELIHSSIDQDRMVAQVVTFFGVLALVLSALGLYGVMAYATLRRTSEFGLRMALGADSLRIARMVLRDAMLMAGAGVCVGLPVALATTRLLRDQLFEVGPMDGPSIALAVVVLTASALVAGYLPARRAARVAPLEALREE